MRWTRRELLEQGQRGALCLAGGLLMAAFGCSKSEPSCVDPDLLSTPERALRKSQGYVDHSPHGREKNCAGCEFFRQEGEAGCGRCQILGGPVSAGGHCSAWSPKKAKSAAGTPRKESS